MANETAASLWGFTVGDTWEDHFSRVSVLGLVFWVCAYVQALAWRKMDDWKAEVSRTADETRYGTAPWWERKALEFQLGDTVEVIDGKMGYAVEDADKRIVTAATVVTVGRTLNVKVAKGAVGQRGPLSASELTALQSYLDAIKPLGVVVDALSSAADTVTLGGVIRYNGQVTQAAMEEAVEAAVEAACDNLAFGGTLYAAAVTHALMGLNGVVDASVVVRVNGNIVSDYVVPASGYVTTGSFDIEYIAI